MRHEAVVIVHGNSSMSSGACVLEMLLPVFARVLSGFVKCHMQSLGPVWPRFELKRPSASE